MGLFPGIFNTQGGCRFSDCMTYRYDLQRKWDDGKPLFLIIMLNPSTADGQKDDPTTRKCLHYARREGCGHYAAVNLFAFRSPKPKIMKAFDAPIGPDTDGHLVAWLLRAKHTVGSRIVVAWGNDGTHMGRDVEVMKLITGLEIRPICFGTNKNGSPKHPTYLSNNLDLIQYEMKPLTSEGKT